MTINRKEKHEISQKFNSSGNLFIVSKHFGTSRFLPSFSGRTNINHFSKSSAVRMRKYLRTTESDYSIMVTLTYPNEYPKNGKIVKEHLRRFLQELKRESERNVKKENNCEFSAFWFLEFQERGAPHFHIFTNRRFNKMWLSKKWYEICETYDEKHLRIGTRIEKLRGGRGATCSYASKYAAKLSQKSVPECFLNVGRFWGISGNRRVVSADTTVTDEQIQDNEEIQATVSSIKSIITGLNSKNEAKFLKKSIENVDVIVINKKIDQIRLYKLVVKLKELVINDALSKFRE